MSTEVPSAHVVLGMQAVWFLRDRVLSHGNGDINWLLSYIRMQASVYLLQRALGTWGGLLCHLKETQERIGSCQLDKVGKCTQGSAGMLG